MVDYEGEIAVVIAGLDEIFQSVQAGTTSPAVFRQRCFRARRPARRNAERPGNRHRKDHQGKTFPSFKPIGPCILTADDIRDRP